MSAEISGTDPGGEFEFRPIFRLKNNKQVEELKEISQLFLHIYCNVVIGIATLDGREKSVMT